MIFFHHSGTFNQNELPIGIWNLNTDTGRVLLENIVQGESMKLSEITEKLLTKYAGFRIHIIFGGCRVISDEKGEWIKPTEVQTEDEELKSSYGSIFIK